MRILVTGGAGFIGSHSVDLLLESGYDVRVLDALVPQVHGGIKPRHLNSAAEFIHANIGDAEAVERALDGVEAVLHLAAEVGIGQSMYEIKRFTVANTCGTAVLLQAVIGRRHQIRKLVVASSMSVYGEGAYTCSSCGPVSTSLRGWKQLQDRRWELECPCCGAPVVAAPTSENKVLNPTSVYAVTKQDEEQLSLIIGRAYGIPTVALRYFSVYGTRQALSNPYTGVWAIFSSRLLNNQRPVIFEDGKQSRDYVFVTDVARANLLALQSPRADFHAINIGTGRATTISDVARMLAAHLGKGTEPEITGSFREGDIRHCTADTRRARDLLKFEPVVTVEDGVPDLIEWIRAQKPQDATKAAMAELAARSLIR